ncbi:hypothetical protein [Kitasatospora paracochleata]|uniref:Uncharacterized protein n=1 Tax=Kitasatospora paracochleata TaxID=58354 RepID=A0ABT1J9Y8_9ACTN|nr:hypothetical protein [Kitasatospora paracochleata]MCP2314271.1 hypothetical protein [Kitasatospora paracochleata]
MKYRMHILDDPSELSERAQDLLRRTGRRERPVRFEVPIEMWRVRDRTGRLVPAPLELIIRCEGFEQRFRGLRYQVRHSWTLDGERYETGRSWEYDHFGVKTGAWQDPVRGGWYFEWLGERVSKPCRDLLHTDGGVGTDVDGGSPYLPVAPSVTHLIESHALTDAVSVWRPWPVAGSAAVSAAEALGGLVEVPEASWETSRWRLSDSVAVFDSESWDRENPSRRVRIWSRNEVGHREVRNAFGSG